MSKKPEPEKETSVEDLNDEELLTYYRGVRAEVKKRGLIKKPPEKQPPPDDESGEKTYGYCADCGHKFSTKKEFDAEQCPSCGGRRGIIA